MHTTLSLSARVFYLIRYHDVELAEDFSRRCPNVNDLNALNQFFHMQFSQYNANTQTMRRGLVDTQDFDQWGHAFVNKVLPELRARRFPPCTHLHQPSVYEERAQAVG